MGLECFEIFDGILNGYRAGTKLRVRNYQEPLPESLHFLKTNATRCERPANFDALPLVDVGAALAEVQEINAVINAPPVRWLDSKELWEKCPFTKDPQQFALAVTQEKFPRPETFKHWFGNVGPVTEKWNEKLVDAWLADTRARRDRLDAFLAGTR